MDQDTLGKMADATGEVAKTADTALQLAGKFGSLFRGPLETAARMMDNEIKFIAAKRGLALSDKWEKLMNARGLSTPTRTLPINFVVPLLSAAVLEEDDELQETWARLLVNAGDAARKMELRTAYVQILQGMSGFDVKNLAVLCRATLALKPDQPRGVLTPYLPEFSQAYPGYLTNEPAISPELGISLANLSRLGCAMPAGGADGAVLYAVMSVTDLGLGLYAACSPNLVTRANQDPSEPHQPSESPLGGTLAVENCVTARCGLGRSRPKASVFLTRWSYP
jgi:Abortive infection alpha